MNKVEGLPEQTEEEKKLERRRKKCKKIMYALGIKNHDAELIDNSTMEDRLIFKLTIRETRIDCNMVARWGEIFDIPVNWDIRAKQDTLGTLYTVTFTVRASDL